VDYHGIGWAESAEIRKSNDSRTINISKDKNLAVIMIKDKYLFSWDDVPGNDNWRLIDFLKQNYGIDWVETEKIRKIDENNTINVSTEKNSLDLKLNDEKTNVSLEIDGSRIGEFTAKMENGNIYVTKMENAILKISNQSYDLKLEKKDDKFRLSPSTNVRFSEHDLHFLAIIFLLSSILFIWLLLKTKKQRKQIKAEFRDLFIFFCCTPAIVVAALAVAGNDLLRFPNVAGPIVVGVLLISGFYTLVTIATMSFSSEDNLYHVFVCLALASLAAISGLTVLFSLSVPQEVLEEFGKLLNFAVAIILVVLLYGFFYEKMEKYRFTEWWRREWRPIAIALGLLIIPRQLLIFGLWMIFGLLIIEGLWIIPGQQKIPKIVAIILVVLLYGFFYEKMEKYRFTEWLRREWRPIAIAIAISIVMIVVSALYPELAYPMLGLLIIFGLWIIPRQLLIFGLWMIFGVLIIPVQQIIPKIDVPVKLLVILIALVVMLILPWIIGMFGFYKHIQYRGFRLPKIYLPEYQGIVLVKVKTHQGSLQRVVKKLDRLEGVYQTMVVRGEYDVCLIVEGVDSDDITEKILSIRKIGDDVVSTTTLTDIREFFDREVR